MKILRLKPGDEEKALEIVSIFKVTKMDSKHIREFLSSDTNYLIVAYAERKTAGFILGYELQRMGDKEPMMLLYEIGVLEEYQRQGIASRLIKEFQRICRDKGFLKMFVITNESNIPAMKLYESTGGIRESGDDVVFNYKFK